MRHWLARADSVGHRVARAPFEGIVLGVAARYALVSVAGETVALVTAGQGRGPSSVRLTATTTQRIDHWLAPGEACRCADGWLETPHASVDLRQAAIWRSPPPQVRVERSVIARRVRALPVAVGATAGAQAAGYAGAEAWRREAWAGAALTLGQHCRDRDAEDALAVARGLVGRGCGSTPAGDDFLVGLLAGLGALACGDPARCDFLATFGAALAAGAARLTTALSAQYLRHAAAGDFSEPLASLRDAIIAAADDHALAPTLAAALAVGASSGVAGVAGLTTGLQAWIEAPPCGR